jgi:glutaconate CoA-transferase subunit B
MRVDSLHPGVTLDQVQSTVGWEPKVAPGPALATTPEPSPEELRLIREELDPTGAYTG